MRRIAIITAGLALAATLAIGTTALANGGWSYQGRAGNGYGYQDGYHQGRGQHYYQSREQNRYRDQEAQRHQRRQHRDRAPGWMASRDWRGNGSSCR